MGKGVTSTGWEVKSRKEWDIRTDGRVMKRKDRVMKRRVRCEARAVMDKRKDLGKGVGRKGAEKIGGQMERVRRWGGSDGGRLEMERELRKGKGEG